MDRPNILIITSDHTRWNSLPAIQNALHGHCALLSEVDHHVGCMLEAFPPALAYRRELVSGSHEVLPFTQMGQ